MRTADNTIKGSAFMSKFLTVALISAVIILGASKAHAKPKINCPTISKAQYSNFRSLPKDSSKATLDRVLGSAGCQLSGYGAGFSAYGHRTDSKNWLVVVYKNGKHYKSKILPFGMTLREG